MPRVADTRTMRTRKPAAPSGGPACHRCTALLHAGTARCSMCGWPAGVGYPPSDGELEKACAPSAEPEPDAPVDEDTAAQLDALAGMAQRQAQPPAEQAPPRQQPADAEVDPLTAPLEAVTDPRSPTAIPEPVATPVYDETSTSVEETAVIAASST